MVTDNLLLRPEPTATAQIKLLSVVHAVVPQMLVPTWTLEVTSDEAKFSPHKVRLPPPVVGELSVVACVIKGPSNVNAAIWVPTIVSTVTRLAIFKPEPPVVLHETDVEDIHCDDPQSVLPRTEVGLVLCAPKLRPSIVTAPPDAVGPFGESTFEIMGASYVKLSDKVPIRVCKSKATCVCRTPPELRKAALPGARQMRVEDVVHETVGQLDSPTRPVGVLSWFPKLIPIMVTDAPDEVGELSDFIAVCGLPRCVIIAAS